MDMDMDILLKPRFLGIHRCCRMWSIFNHFDVLS